MTETEWLACTDPDDLLEFLRDRASDRQFRLFMCACCRRFLPLMPRKPAHDVRICEKYVAHGEQFAEGLITWEEMEAALAKMDLVDVSHEGYLAALAARQAIYRVVAGCDRPMLRGRNVIAHPASTASGYARTVVGRLEADNKAARGSTPTSRKRMATIAEKRYQIQLLHDIFGNPFRSVAFDRNWQTANVVNLARAAYEERRLPSGDLEPNRLAILADSLEEDGCANAEVLAHLHGAGPHVRGCWALDACLVKVS
jgi:hypothetical protein